MQISKGPIIQIVRQDNAKLVTLSARDAKIALQMAVLLAHQMLSK